MFFDQDQDETMGGRPPADGFGPGFAGMGAGGRPQPGSLQGLPPQMKMILMGEVIKGGDPFKTMAAMAQLQQAQREQQMQAEMQAPGGPQGAPGGMPPGGPGGAPGGPPGAPGMAPEQPQDPRIAMLQRRADIALKYNRPDVAQKYYSMAASLAKPTDEWGKPEREIDRATGQPVLVQYSKGGQRRVVPEGMPEQEVHAVIEVRGPDGKMRKVPMGKDGKPINEGMPGYVKPELADLGGRKVFVEPEAGQSYDVTMTPGQVDESKRGWANVGIAQGQLGVSQGQLGVSRANQATSAGQLTLAQQRERREAEKDARGVPLTGPAVTNLSEQAGVTGSTNRLAGSFDDSFAGKKVLGDWDNTFKRVMGDKSGQAQWWQDYSLHEATVRNKLFGASLTASEQGQWQKLTVTPNMDPKQVKENLQRRQQIENDGLARLVKSYKAAGYNQAQIDALVGESGKPVAPKQSARESSGAVANGMPKPNKSAIAYLKANPGTVAQFEATFGPGTAAQYLGGK